MLITLTIITLLLCWLVFKPVKYNPQDSFKVEVLAYSKSEYDVMAVSFYLMYPRFIHSEMMTHKDFSRSAASSRAIPVAKMLSQVWNKPAMPVHWGANIAGMQAKSELSGWKRRVTINLWMLAGKTACVFVWFLNKVKLHKQVANRILEPWQLMHVTLTTSKLANFFNLRIHSDAQPEICYLATKMRDQLIASKPMILKKGQWHLPWISPIDFHEAREISFNLCIPQQEVLKRASTARCARSSYGTFAGERSLVKDLELYDKLVVMKPVHASPAEHQVTPDVAVGGLLHVTSNGKEEADIIWSQPKLHGNMIGWIQHRKQIPDHYFEG